MTPQDQKILTQSIQANRRSLSLLDKRLDDLSKSRPSILSEYDTYDKQPFFYAAVGPDNQIGIPVVSSGASATTDVNPAFGYVRTNPDSAFVLTRISMASTEFPFGLAIGSVTRRVQEPGSGLFGVRFYDESSSRWITFTNRDSQPQQRATLPVSLFSPYASYNEGGFTMPCECVFPRSAVIRVELYRLETGGMNRLQVVFQGYKVYGG